MTIEKLTSFGKGDIIVLSDTQSILDANDLTQELTIQDVRTYISPSDIFEYTGYIAEGPNDITFMVMVKVAGNKHEIFVYYLEAEGKLYEAKNNQEECPLLALFDEELDDLRERIEVAVTTSSDSCLEVNWDKQEVINGVLLVEDGDKGVCTLGEYYTADENEGNSYALIDLRGEPNDGYVEVWYGCPIKDQEIDFIRMF